MTICDLHCDTISNYQAGTDLTDEAAETHISIPALQAGHVNIQIFACFVSSMTPPGNAYNEACSMLDSIDQMCTEYGQYLRKTDSRDEIKQSINSGKIAVIAAIENGYAIENDLHNLENLYMKGARYLTLTHSKNNDWAASSGEEKCNFEGLTNFGKKVIEAMNEMGMIVDVSHVHKSTLHAVAQLSKKPFIASHSCVSSLCATPRNLDDDDIKTIADSGGMIGINFFPGFLDNYYHQNLAKKCGSIFDKYDYVEKTCGSDPKLKMSEMKKLNYQLSSNMKDHQVTLQHIIKHIKYVCDLVGDEFVGFGSDFDGVPDLPVDLKNCGDYPNIISELEKIGFSKKSIDRITHKNFLRIFSSR